MRATVTTVNKSSYDVYIGRPSIFGNPFHIGEDGTRMEVVFKHFIYFHKRLISNSEFKLAVHALKGKKLGCYCHDWNGIGENPMYCHGDNIADYLNGLAEYAGG